MTYGQYKFHQQTSTFLGGHNFNILIQNYISLLFVIEVVFISEKNYRVQVWSFVRG